MITRLILFTALGFAHGLYGDQEGAERTKIPKSARIISSHKECTGFAGRAIGNVQILYQDGTKDLWTLKRNASSPQVSSQGVVGWVITPLQKDGKTLETYRNHPLLPRLRLVHRGKVLATIESAMPFIEDWTYWNHGEEVIIKSRRAHGPASIQRFSVKDGRLLGQTLAYEVGLPAWAKPFAE